MAQDFYVYTHARKDDGATFYVGKGRGDRAWRESRRSVYWQRVVAKHGRTVRVVASGLPEELALLAEVELIEKLTRLGANLVNMTVGGDGARLTEEAEKRRQAAIRAAHLRPEVRAKQREISQRIAASPVTLSRRSAAIRAAYQRPEVRATIAANARSPKALAAHKVAMQKPEVRAKLSAAQSRPVECIETGQVFPMVLAATRWLQSQGHERAQGGHICQACAGKRKTAYGLTWRYAPKT